MRTPDYTRVIRDGDTGRTKDGRRIVSSDEYAEWIRAAQILFDRYRCDQCESVVWQTKSGLEDVTLPCGEPCRGSLRKVGVPFVMGGKR